jgi:hypothetical protein
MFKNCSAMVTPPTFDYSSVLQANEMFSGCSNILNLTFNNLISSNISCDNIVNGCNRLTTLGFSGKTNKASARKIIDVFNNFVLDSKVSVSDLSKKVDNTNTEIHNINNYQNLQDNEILMNMLASADIFEMMLEIMSMQLNTKNTKGVNKMAELYATLIIKGKKTIDDVPVMLRPQVESILKEMGVEYK